MNSEEHHEATQFEITLGGEAANLLKWLLQHGVIDADLLEGDENHPPNSAFVRLPAGNAQSSLQLLLHSSAMSANSSSTWHSGKMKLPPDNK